MKLWATVKDDKHRDIWTRNGWISLVMMIGAGVMLVLIVESDPSWTTYPFWLWMAWLPARNTYWAIERKLKGESFSFPSQRGLDVTALHSHESSWADESGWAR